MSTKHEVVLQTDCLAIKRSGIKLHINEGGGKLGRLIISNGKIEWFPENKQNGFALTWAKFAVLMQNHGSIRRAK